MMATEVLVGQVWTRKDPSGAVVRFRVASLIRDSRNTRIAIGVVNGRKNVRCRVAEMEAGGDRFALVSESAVMPACSGCGVPSSQKVRLRRGMCSRCYHVAMKGRAA